VSESAEDLTRFQRRTDKPTQSDLDDILGKQRRDLCNPYSPPANACYV